jgi:hypothetical protein
MTRRGDEAVHEIGGGCYTVGVSEGQFLNKLTVNGGDKAGHSAARIQAMEHAPSGMTRALTR